VIEIRVKVYNSYTERWETVNLPFWKYLVLRLVGRVYLERRRYPGWRDTAPFYIFRCPRHGFILDYPHGWGQVLYCKLCEEEYETGKS